MKKAIYVLVVLSLIFAINNMGRSIYNLWHKKDLLTQAQKQLDREKEENKKLKEEITRAQSKDFIEQEARNKLFLGKPGEQIVIIPQKLFNQKENKKSFDVRPNWQKWWDLFFRN
ncbi:septum formation initiator family protein [Patescibacteria group bacterium]|nr:septum formation initiator family protein [Patescibacteria group bacterium]